ncbi:MAG: hypothetical protein WEE64_15740 [Dehalococcoidia bacterium]
MRYPIFLFYDENDVVCYESLDQLQSSLEPDDLGYIDIGIYDSDGHLFKVLEGDRAIELGAAEPTADPQRLRRLLIGALRAPGQRWATDAPLEAVISASQEAFRYEEGVPMSEAISRLLQWLRLKRPK